MRATAFLMRSIRQDSRLLSHHLMRGAMAFLILYLFFMQYRVFALRAAAGSQFANTVINCCYWFLTLVGGIHFSTAIVEEKEEQTLTLLRMTGASAFSILAGKSIPRLAIVILFLCVVAPFLMLAMTLGGLVPLGLLSAILGICCYSIMLSQVGLLASVVCKDASRAFAVTAVGWVALELSHWWYGMAEQLSKPRYLFGNTGLLEILQGPLSWISQCSLIANLSDDLLTFATVPPELQGTSVFHRTLYIAKEIFHFHMGFHLVLAAVLFVVSWLLFESCTSRAVSEGDSGASVSTKIASPRQRPWQDAIVWKSWQHVSGGHKWFWIRVIVAPVAIAGLAILLSVLFDGDVEPEFVAGVMIFGGIGFFTVNLCRLFGRLLNAELHQKTMASLVMLPQPTSQTLWSMVWGLIPAVCAGAACSVIGFLWMVVQIFDNYRSIRDVVEVIVEPWFWHLLSWNLLSIHLGLLLTTHIRYGGMVLGYVLLWILAPICCTSFIGVFGSSGGFGRAEEDFLRYLIPLGLIVAELAICFGLQKTILKRVELLTG